MAHLVLAEEEYQARFGPTPAFTPASGCYDDVVEQRFHNFDSHRVNGCI